MNGHDLDALARTTVDCGYKIHVALGPGLLESAYEALLAAHLARAGLAVERQKSIDIRHDGLELRDAFRADLVIEGQLIVEVKSVERLQPVHFKQLMTYLRLTDRPLGLLINFGAATFREGVRRVANGHDDSQRRS